MAGRGTWVNMGVRESEGPDPRRGVQEEQWGRKAGPHA